MSSSREIRSRTRRGIGAAQGLAAGPAAVWREQAVTIPRSTGRQPATETARLSAARAAARNEIRALRAKVAAEAGQAEAAIFDAHEMFIDDAALLQKAQQAIDRGVNAEAAWADAIEFFASQLEQLPDPTLRARAADVRDVGGRVLDHLLGRGGAGLRLDEPSVVVSRDLAPSQIASLPVAPGLACVTPEGGPTSHTAILAKAWGKPAVVGVGTAVLELRDGTAVLVDGTRGEVVIDPDEQTTREFSQRRAAAERQAATERGAAGDPAITRDHRRGEVVADIGAVAETAGPPEHRAGGHGLPRTRVPYSSPRPAPPQNQH